MRSRDSYLPRARASWFWGGAIAKPLPLAYFVRGAAKIPHHSDDAPGTHIGRMEKRAIAPRSEDVFGTAVG